MMRTLTWVRGKSAPVLAARWGYEVSSVENISAEAWRRVKTEALDPEIAALDIVDTIRTVMADSMADAADPGDEEGKAVHRRVALDAARTYAAIVVPKPTERYEITHRLADMTPQQLEARKREIAAEILALPAREDDE